MNSFFSDDLSGKIKKPVELTTGFGKKGFDNN